MIEETAHFLGGLSQALGNERFGLTDKRRFRVKPAAFLQGEDVMFRPAGLVPANIGIKLVKINTGIRDQAHEFRDC
jgi:hypothetical protein